ncbi:MAG: hypothetical protein HY983_04265 [Candidatus Magasanikbacteria bacterium]|nr:hypothetical protein [Candidatus Magasanikbacteria bacterium]
MENENKKSVFEGFTRKYALNKTLRFSLVPVLTVSQEDSIVKEKGYQNKAQIRRQEKVEKFLVDNKQNIFEVDIERKKRYRALKYYLTELHKLFIKDALGKIKELDISFSDLFERYKEFEKEKDDTKMNQIFPAAMLRG